MQLSDMFFSSYPGEIFQEIGTINGKLSVKERRKRCFPLSPKVKN